MVFLKAAGIVLACILALIALLLIALLHFRFVFTLEGEPKAELRIFFIKINLLARREKKPKKPKKKPRRFAAYLKRKFGFEHPPEAPAPEGETVSAKAKWVYALIMIVAGRVKWLLKRVKLEKLRILAVCGGGDAAESAMEYGTVCAVLYPLAGFIRGSTNACERNIDVRVGCAFTGEPVFEFELRAAIRIIHIVRALIWGAARLAENAQITEEQK